MEKMFANEILEYLSCMTVNKKTPSPTWCFVHKEEESFALGIF
jgi:hypothetical protein